jgi:SRSO17 transposase
MKTDDFDHYLEQLAAALGHVDRIGPMKEYCTGLMLPAQRKSVEPLVARLDPWHVSAKHQSPLHFVGQSDWSDEAMLNQVRAWVQPLMAREASHWFWIVDEDHHRIQYRSSDQCAYPSQLEYQGAPFECPGCSDQCAYPSQLESNSEPYCDESVPTSAHIPVS